MTDLVIALDVDGVVLDAGRGDAWLDVVAADFGLTAEDFYPFFQEKWTDIAFLCEPSLSVMKREGRATSGSGRTTPG
jgi:hypothetical protein